MGGALGLLMLGTALTASLDARVLLSQREALDLAFPGSSVERRTAYLTEEEGRRIESLAQARADSRLVAYYVGRSTRGLEGYAFFETHTVRTMPETFMVVLDPEGTVRFVEMLAFYEPEDYLPPPRWLALFRDKGLGDSLRVKRGIRNISGATLTAQAVSDGVRRVLATFEVAVRGGESGASPSTSVPRSGAVRREGAKHP